MEKSLEYTSRVNKNNANDYLELCREAENALHELKYDKPKTDVRGYTPFLPGDNSGLRGSNFKAVIYQKGEEYVIYFFGTDVKSPKDLYADAKMFFKGRPQQFTDAEEFTRNFLDKNPHISPQNITLLGHSEGGSEAMYVKAVIPGIKAAYTFNPFVPTIVNADEENLQNIYNFRTPGDPISKIGGNIGEDFIVKCNYEEVRKGPLNRLDQHRLDSFGDCNDAVTPAVFKKQNPKFKNKFRNEQLSAEDISSIPEEYYGFVEEDINASIAAFGTEETNPQHNSSQCPGTYQVSGYTREDGTKVPAHVRTCHVHNSL